MTKVTITGDSAGTMEFSFTVAASSNAIACLSSAADISRIGTVTVGARIHPSDNTNLLIYVSANISGAAGPLPNEESIDVTYLLS